MTKKRKSKLSFPALFIALTIGIIVGRNIPETWAYDDKAIQNQFYAQESLLPGQPISSFVIHRSGYSWAYDAQSQSCRRH